MSSFREDVQYSFLRWVHNQKQVKKQRDQEKDTHPRTLPNSCIEAGSHVKNNAPKADK